MAVASRDPAHLAGTRAAIEGLGRRALAIPCGRARHGGGGADGPGGRSGPGGLEILVNNAAGNFPCAAENLSANGFRAVVEIVPVM